MSFQQFLEILIMLFSISFAYVFPGILISFYVNNYIKKNDYETFLLKKPLWGMLKKSTVTADHYFSLSNSSMHMREEEIINILLTRQEIKIDQKFIIPYCVALCFFLGLEFENIQMQLDNKKI